MGNKNEFTEGYDKRWDKEGWIGMNIVKKKLSRI